MNNSTITEIVAELERATVKFPTWPTDPLHALGVLHEEVGELSKEVLQLVYEPHKTSAEAVRREAFQAAAMALRFAMSLDAYVYAPGPQHAQAAPKCEVCAGTWTTGPAAQLCGAHLDTPCAPWHA